MLFPLFSVLRLEPDFARPTTQVRRSPALPICPACQLAHKSLQPGP